MKIPVKTFLMAAIALAGWFGLVLQLYLIIESANRNNLSLFSEVVRFFSYFTILTNLMVAVSITGILIGPQTDFGKFCLRPFVQTGVAFYILVVGVVYSAALRAIWNPRGLQLVADRILHDFIPVLFILYWIFFVPKKSLKWDDALWWLLYPFFYLVYALVRGSITGVYPYYFIDRNILSWPGIMINVMILLSVFAALGFFMVWIGRLIARMEKY